MHHLAGLNDVECMVRNRIKVVVDIDVEHFELNVTSGHSLHGALVELFAHRCSCLFHGLCLSHVIWRYVSEKVLVSKGDELGNASRKFANCFLLLLSELTIFLVAALIEFHETIDTISTFFCLLGNA